MNKKLQKTTSHSYFVKNKFLICQINSEHVNITKKLLKATKKNLMEQNKKIYIDRTLNKQLYLKAKMYFYCRLLLLCVYVFAAQIPLV